MRHMGGLGKQMPLVRGVFIIGGLALAGLPIANGFFSKELILEGAWANAPQWAAILMLIGAGLTALYTLRMVYLVFFGEPRSPLHAHDAQTAMKVSLGVLAVGACTTWLLAGPLYQLLTSTLPFHHFPELTTLDMISEVLTAPTTYLALFVVAIGALCWWKRDALSGVTTRLQGFARMATNTFGFEAINRGVVRVTQNTAEALRVTQTGLLSWNVAGIAIGLIVVLIVLAWGK
jgi:NADH-quinone oxidoreductase subunit L